MKNEQGGQKIAKFERTYFLNGPLLRENGRENVIILYSCFWDLGILECKRPRYQRSPKKV